MSAPVDMFVSNFSGYFCTTCSGIASVSREVIVLAGTAPLEMKRKKVKEKVEKNREIKVGKKMRTE